MKNIIILTSILSEGLRLKERLVSIDSSFSDVTCKIKEEIGQEDKCEFIFSTWYMPQFSEDEIKSSFPNLKGIFYAAGTVKSFAEPFLKHGVRIFSASAANGQSVAEFTVGQILLANKGYFMAARNFRWPIWRHGFNKNRNYAENHSGNFNSVIGLLGCGSVGSKVAELLKPFSIKVLVYDPYLSSDQAEKLGVESVDIHYLFQNSDVISNHLPDIMDTKGIIDYTLLSSMKPYATLINTGRGAQIKETDLARAMRNRKDLTALLDVTSHEPPFPWSPLYHCKNIVMTPHIAGSSNNEIDRMVMFVYESYKQVISNQEAQGEITLSQLKNKA